MRESIRARLFVVGMVASFAACRCERLGTSAARGDAAVDAAIAEVDAGAPAAVLVLNEESIVYDVATGKRLSEHESVPVISPNGEWTIDRQSIRTTRTGEEIVKLPENAYLGSEGSPWSPWFDGGAMVWAKSGLAVADPKARSVVTVPAQCNDGETDQRIEVVDPATKQAVRFCGPRVLVVRVGTGSAPAVVEVPVPASRKEMRRRWALRATTARRFSSGSTPPAPRSTASTPTRARS